MTSGVNPAGNAAASQSYTPYIPPVQEILRPLGLITQPNKMGQYAAGALRTASGLYLRDPGVLSTQNVFSQQFAGAWSASASAFELMPVDGLTQFKYLTFYLNPDVIWRYAFDNNAGAAIQYFLSAYTVNQESLQPGTGYGRVRGYTINGSRLVIPAVASTNIFDLAPSGTPVPRIAGIAHPHIFDLQPISTTATNATLPTGTHVHYVAVQRRVFADNTELLSAPCPANYIRNESGGPNNVRVRIITREPTKAGDYVDVYKTKRQLSAVNTGADYYLCGSVKASSSGQNILDVFDGTNDENLGRALYTNSGLGGEGATNACPPVCNAVATFKGYTFYLGVTEPPSQTLRIGSGVFFTALSTAATLQYRTFGIGRRDLTGNCANGGNQITAVSAADMTGIVIGQQLVSSPVSFSATMTVSATGVSTITFTGGTFLAASTGGNFAVSDVLEIDAQSPSIVISTFDDIFEGVGFFSPYVDTIGINCLDRVLPPAALASVSFLNATIAADSFTIYRPFSLNSTICTGPLKLRATNGANYTPQLPKIELNETALSISPAVRKNMMRWSEQNNAEACAVSSFAFCGAGEMYRAYSTRDAMWIFASDGLWRLSGTGGTAGAGYDWRLDPVDSTISLSGPRCGCVLRDTVYAYTNRGFVSIDSSGTIREISQGRVQDLMPGPAWSDTQAAFVFFDETNDEITIKTELGGVIYVYNILTDAFTTLVVVNAPFDGAFIRADGRVAHVTTGGIYAQNSGSHSAAGSIADYQPVYGEDPFAIHHWQSMDLAFDTQNQGQTVGARFNQVDGSSHSLTVGGQSFARSGYGIGRNTPAVANCIQPGWKQGAGGLSVLRFFGLALHKKTITQQRYQR